MKLLIPSAGIGSRINAYTKKRNKALVTVGGKPAIVRIIDYYIEHFDIDQVVIIIGYKGEILEDCLRAFYDDSFVEFVYVDKYEGLGSGLGYTLSKAKHLLQCEFIFSTNDTLLTLNKVDMRTDSSFAIYKTVSPKAIDVSQFRTLEISDNKVIKLNPKGLNCHNVYLGVCFIKDYTSFWAGMAHESALLAGEVIGLQALTNLRAIEALDWFDLGQVETLRETQRKHKVEDIEVLEKNDEAIWFTGGEVIKHHIDPTFIEDRINRLNYLPAEITPELTSRGKYFYKYNMVEGKTISSDVDRNSFQELLGVILQQLWSNQCEDPERLAKLKTQALDFYQVKTLKRVSDYINGSEYYDRDVVINGVSCPPILEVLTSVNWTKLIDNCHFANFHGDLHNENILKTKTGFCLLDWRQNFGPGEYEFGDVYYDQAKLRHGLMVNHSIVNKGSYSVRHFKNGDVIVEILQSSRLVEIDDVLTKFIVSEGYNEQFLNFVTALIYLNIAALHDAQYGEFLFYYGRLKLNDALMQLSESTN
ncbi:hypothetical protein N9J60_00655 [Alphaproteobacteria bacterium]|nr:hypothetical protein [Alphaproteobacteria bacterium]